MTPEKLQGEIKKAWWKWKGTLINTAPPKAKEQISLHPGDDMYIHDVLVVNHCFSYEHIRTKVYPAIHTLKVMNAAQNAIRQALKEAKKNGGKNDFAKLCLETSKSYDDDFRTFVFHYRTPTDIELFCYIESLRIAKNWKQLEQELANPEVLNYIWDTAVIIDNWQVAMSEAHISLIQPDMKTYDKMFMVATILRNKEAISYYGEAQKKK